jgi:hypothetical protein
METMTFISPSVQPRTETNAAEPYTPLPGAPVRGAVLMRDAVPETVFDANITKDEILELFGFELSREEYMQTMRRDSALGDLWVLFRMRGEVQKAEEYKNLITDKAYKTRLGYTDLVPSL